MPWLIAFAAKYVGEKFAAVVVYAVIAVLLAGTAAVIWQTRVRGPYIAEGEAKAAKVYEPKVKALTLERDGLKGELAGVTADRDKLLTSNASLMADVGTLRERVANQTDAITKLQKANAALRAAAKVASDAADRAAEGARAEIARLAAVASGPALVDACAQAERILSDLSDFARATP